LPITPMESATLALHLCSLARPCVDLPKCNQKSINPKSVGLRLAWFRTVWAMSQHRPPVLRRVLVRVAMSGGASCRLGWIIVARAGDGDGTGGAATGCLVIHFKTFQKRKLSFGPPRPHPATRPPRAQTGGSPDSVGGIRREPSQLNFMAVVNSWSRTFWNAP
jgi:hypothetical protein